MEIRYCEVDQVQIGERLRSVDVEKVSALAESMDAIGLQQPISVWSGSIGTLELVAGLHRLEAARKLGWEEIDCIFVNMDDLDRQLWQIDENLMRAELGPAEMAEHTAKRAELVKQKAAIVKGQLVQKPAHRPSEGQEEFEEETAKATGKSTKTVRRDKARGEAIPADVLGKIRGTELDTGVYLDKLKKLTRDEMRERVERDLEKIDRRKNGANLKEEEDRCKQAAADERRRDFANMGEILERLSSEKCERFLILLAKYSAKTARDLRPWTNI